MDNTQLGLIALAIFVASFFFKYVYFLPTKVAEKHDRKNKAAIRVLNIFLGWTLIGWVVALVWANMED